MRGRTGSLVLVGNGPSLLDREVGALIDAFPEVVRFNSYVVQGFERQVGTRTTIWSRWYALPTMQDMRQLSRVWLNMPVHERTPQKIEKALSLLGPHVSKAEIIPRLEVAEALQKRLYGGPHSHFWPSSGLLAIAHAIDLGYDLAIAGFDSWQKEPFHYYGPHDRTGTHHDASVELRHINGLVHSKVVTVL